MDARDFTQRILRCARLDFTERRRTERTLAKSVPHQLTALSELIAHGDVAVRRTTVEVLRRHASNSGVEALLVRRLTDEPDVKTRRRLAVALAEGRPAVAPRLMDALGREEHRFVQASLILALGKLAWDRWPDAWRQRAHDDGPVGEALRKALGRGIYPTERSVVPMDRPVGRYLLNVYPGIEALSALERPERLRTLSVPKPGWIEVDAAAPQDLEALGDLRTVLGDFHRIAEAPAARTSSPDGLEQLLVDGCAQILDGGWLAHDPSPTFRLALPRVGNRRQYRRAVQKLSRGVERHTGWRNSPSDYTVDLRAVDLGESLAVVWRHSGWPTVERPERNTVAASIHPTVAAALCLAARDALPGLETVITTPRLVDPCCGGGTVLTEWLAQGPGTARGFDIDPSAVDLARHNLADSSGHCTVETGDLGELPLADGSVDAVVANLPFGLRVRHGESNRRLYGRFVREARRIIGRGVLVAYTADHHALRDTLEAEGLLTPQTPEQPLATVEAGGMSVRVFRINTVNIRL